MSNLPAKKESEKNKADQINFYSKIETEVNVHSKNIVKKNKKVFLKIIVSIMLLIFSFFIGLIVFFPLNQIFDKVMKSLAANGVPIEYSKTNFSLLGSYSIENISVKNLIDAKKKNKLEVLQLKGDINLWSYLLSSKNNKKVETKVELKGIDVLQKDIKVFGNIISLDIVLKNILKHKSKWTGRIKLESENLFLEINKEFPMIGKLLPVSFKKIKLSLLLKNGYLYFEGSNFLNSNLAYIKITGKYQLVGKNNIDLTVIVDPKEELYVQYKNQDFKSLFKVLKIIQEDKKIYIDIKGTIKNPRPITRKNRKINHLE